MTFFAAASCFKLAKLIQCLAFSQRETVAGNDCEMIQTAVVIFVCGQIIGVTMAAQRIAAFVLPGKHRGSSLFSIGCHVSTTVTTHECPAGCFRHREGLSDQREYG